MKTELTKSEKEFIQTWDTREQIKRALEAARRFSMKTKKPVITCVQFSRHARVS